MDISEFQDDDNTAAIAKEWGVEAELLEDLEGRWERHDTTTSDGMVVAYYVEFDRDVERELLDALGVPPGQWFRELSLNYNYQPEAEDPNEHYRYLASEYKRLGGRFGAIQVGNHYLLNPWYPDEPKAEQFWRNAIGEIPVSDRTMFLRALAHYGV
jgi:hypothetical protein